MSLYPEPHVIVRSPEHITRLCELLRVYWLANPTRRFEQIVNEPLDDYHYTSDAEVEAWLTQNGPTTGGKS